MYTDTLSLILMVISFLHIYIHYIEVFMLFPIQEQVSSFGCQCFNNFFAQTEKALTSA